MTTKVGSLDQLQRRKVNDEEEIEIDLNKKKKKIKESRVC